MPLSLSVTNGIGNIWCCPAENTDVVNNGTCPNADANRHPLSLASIHYAPCLSLKRYGLLYSQQDFGGCGMKLYAYVICR